VNKALIDSSTLFDISRGTKRADVAWARNTLANLFAYRVHHSKLTISGLTLFEILEGLYRGDNPLAIAKFHENVLPGYEVIQPDAQIEERAAEIHAKLRQGNQAIGVPDTLIAATAIEHDLTLVNANTKHFPRIVAAGFPLKLENWRDG
jgi:tRNA(fMet)-specific endonuclease VapC